MSAPMPMSVFIPHDIITHLSQSSYALGYCKISKNSILINCIALIEIESKSFDETYGLLDPNLCMGQKDKLQFLGHIYSDTEQKNFDTDLLKSFHDIRLIIRMNEISGSFHFEDIFVKHFIAFDVRVVIYDSYSITKSQLLPVTKQVCDVNTSGESFITFLIQTCHTFKGYSNKGLGHESKYCLQESNFTQFDDGTFSQLLSFVLFVISLIISFFYQFISFIFKWWPSSFTNFVVLTALGQQFHQRYLHCSILCTDHKTKAPLSVKSKNLICAILIDLLCGCFVTYAILNTNISNMMLDTAISYTNDIVNGLTNLINWLMGAPAGLKLNIPLNNALGKFFLYHIYLWESYMMVVQPLFAFIFKMSTVIGIFGLTFILSLLNDVISLATIHIYCFYGYATRLYGYQVMSLSALWRLFRGKKWNPLRQRIDSYTYDVHQLYLGTLIFTVLLFLLPTVMVYYFVFTCLRILVLIIQGLVSRLINVLTICPVYSVFSRLLNSPETTGDVYFTVVNAVGVLILSMQASQISLKTVIQLTVPHLKKYQELLTWKEFLSCIVWGRIVYPL